MSKANDALKLLKDDSDKVLREYLDGTPTSSFLQREDMNLDDLVDMFDPQEDENLWEQEYGDPEKMDSDAITLYRRRIAFLKSSRKEFHEEYDPEVTDVDFMRLMEIPYTEPRYVIDLAIGEMGD